MDASQRVVDIDEEIKKTRLNGEMSSASVGKTIL